jgi:hypothetical protein
MSAARLRTDEQVVRYWTRETSAAAAMFERRWTWAALRRVDPSVAARLLMQRDLFDQAIVTGTGDEVDMHGAALCRGYAIATQALEAAHEPDDAYVLGQDPRSGFTVAIGQQKAAAERAVELHGTSVVWITPDEVAAVLAQLEGLKALSTIKRMFPGAEIIDIRPGDRAKRNSGIEER